MYTSDKRETQRKNKNCKWRKRKRKLKELRGIKKWGKEGTREKGKAPKRVSNRKT